MSRPPEALVIGASAGALEALSTVLPALPADVALPVLVVVHVPPDDKSLLAPLLQARCAIRVVEAEDKAPIEKGTAYIAPPDYHLLVERDRTIALSSEEPVHFSRPSIDVLFETAADAYGETLLALVLTGANSDGAAGAARIERGGGRVIVQAPQTASARAMPDAAIAACANAHVLPLAEIGAYIRELAGP